MPMPGVHNRLHRIAKKLLPCEPSRYGEMRMDDSAFESDASGKKKSLRIYLINPPLATTLGAFRVIISRNKKKHASGTPCFKNNTGFFRNPSEQI
jgi:hypothetical protein